MISATKKCVYLVFVLSFLACACVFATEESVLFFYSDDCGACIEMKEFMEKLVAGNPGLLIEMCDIEEHPDLWMDTCRNAGIPAWGVPRIFIGDKNFADFYMQEGGLTYLQSYYGYIGFYNQIVSALEDFFGMPVEIDDFEAGSGQETDCLAGCV